MQPVHSAEQESSRCSAAAALIELVRSPATKPIVASVGLAVTPISKCAYGEAFCGEAFSLPHASISMDASICPLVHFETKRFKFSHHALIDAAQVNAAAGVVSQTHLGVVSHQVDNVADSHSESSTQGPDSKGTSGDESSQANEASMTAYSVGQDGNIPRKDWSVEEDTCIIEAVKAVGFKWRQIASMVPGRSDDSVRNRWKRITTERTAGQAQGLPVYRCSRSPTHLNHHRPTPPRCCRREPTWLLDRIPCSVLTRDPWVCGAEAAPPSHHLSRTD